MNSGAEIHTSPIHAFEGTFNSHPVAFHIIWVPASHRVHKILYVIYTLVLVRDMGSDKHADRQTERDSRQPILTDHVSHHGWVFHFVWKAENTDEP